MATSSTPVRPDLVRAHPRRSTQGSKTAAHRLVLLCCVAAGIAAAAAYAFRNTKPLSMWLAPAKPTLAAAKLC